MCAFGVQVRLAAWLEGLRRQCKPSKTPPHLEAAHMFSRSRGDASLANAAVALLKRSLRLAHVARSPLT